MKIFTFLMLLILVTGISSCESYRQTQDDNVRGTPSRADTVLPHKSSATRDEKKSTSENDSKDFAR